MNNGAGRVIVRSIGQMLCDGQWHRVLARKTKHSLSLKVDGRSYTTPNPYPQSTSAETKNPVYLGGYPGEHSWSLSIYTQLPVTFFNFASLSHSWGKAELPVNNLQVQRLSEECTAH